MTSVGLKQIREEVFDVTTERANGGDFPIILFETPSAWAAWLEQHGLSSPGVWLRLAKKDSPLCSITYGEALEFALCFGWIDGQKRAHDADSWLQKFTPRGPRSVWSKVNREKVQRLIESGQMRAAGLLAVEAAKRDGRWDAAYDSARTATVPEDLQTALDANAEARDFFATLNAANRYAVLYRVQTARTPQTRAKRIQQLVERLAQRQPFHP